VRLLLEELSGRPVAVVASEARAARRGALTTPGAPPGAAVCDIGGGTIDIVDEHAAVTAAGAGELLTLSVGMAAGVPRSTAERVKRYRSFRVESPRLVHDEDGNRRFVSSPDYGRHVGRLCADSGRALLPFHDKLSPEEWRILRLTLKEEVLGANVRRALRALGSAPAELVLCGGCALDDELVRVVADSLRDSRVLVGRANVAGSLGPRYAVALGLVLSRAEEPG
jgi:diol dehydratase reactivase alpha subunit